MITHKRVYVKRFCKFFCNFLTPWRGTEGGKNLPLRGRCPEGAEGESLASVRRFGQWQRSLPHRLRAEPPRRGGQESYRNKSRTAAIPSSVKHTPPLALAVSAVT